MFVPIFRSCWFGIVKWRGNSIKQILRKLLPTYFFGILGKIVLLLLLILWRIVVAGFAIGNMVVTLLTINWWRLYYLRQLFLRTSLSWITHSLCHGWLSGSICCNRSSCTISTDLDIKYGIGVPVVGLSHFLEVVLFHTLLTNLIRLFPISPLRQWCRWVRRHLVRQIFIIIVVIFSILVIILINYRIVTLLIAFINGGMQLSFVNWVLCLVKLWLITHETLIGHQEL